VQRPAVPVRFFSKRAHQARAGSAYCRHIQKAATYTDIRYRDMGNKEKKEEEEKQAEQVSFIISELEL